MKDKPMVTDANPVADLAEHFGACAAIGTLDDRLAYSLDRCGLVLVTEQRLASLVQHKEEAERERDDLRDLLKRVEPHLDAIVCYASTMGEHEPNKIARDVREALNGERM